MRKLAFAVILVAACGDDGGDDSVEMIDAGNELGCPGENPGQCPSQAACDSGDCVDIPFYVCENGAWQEVICEGVFVGVAGTWTISQQVVGTEGPCPELVPRDPLVLTIDVDGAISAEPPIIVVVGKATPGWTHATLNATLLDEWNGVPATIWYQLTVDENGYVQGMATLYVDACTAGLLITGTVVPSA